MEKAGGFLIPVNCSGRQMFPVEEPEGWSPSSIASVHFKSQKCIRCRPNGKTFDYIRAMTKMYSAEGVIAKTLTFCDLWYTEKVRLKNTLSIPVLVVDSGLKKGESRKSFNENRDFHPVAWSAMKDTPKRITIQQWETRVRDIPEDFREECRFLRNVVPGGVPYLFTPYEYSCRGDLLLRRLKFDSSMEALRLWAFLFSEKDRLFLAKENGLKIVSLMKDLGQTAVLTYAFPDQLSFYADELWWAPCFAEETYLLDEAARLGATSELCYVRAALGAMVTGDYFPDPDLCIAGVGGCCDDFSAVMQLIEGLGKEVHWWEMVSRRKPPAHKTAEVFQETPFGHVQYQEGAVPFLKTQFREIVKRMEALTGISCTEDMLKESVSRFNRLRGLVAKLRDLVYSADKPPLPGLEMYLAEFIAIHTCSEPDECFPVLEGLIEVAENRLQRNESPLESEKPCRVYWMYPSTDASLVTLLEDLGGCIAGTDYFINHAFLPLREDTDPLTAVAENCMDDRLSGSPTERIRRIIEDVRKYRAEGILMSGIFGASHCPWDVSALIDCVKEELDIPVMAFDVPYSPGRYSEQVVTRMQGFLELIRSRRKEAFFRDPSLLESQGRPEKRSVLDYFKNSMSVEVDEVRRLKRIGIGIAGHLLRVALQGTSYLPQELCQSSLRVQAAEPFPLQNRFFHLISVPFD